MGSQNSKIRRKEGRQMEGKGKEGRWGRGGDKGSGQGFGAGGWGRAKPDWLGDLLYCA